MGEVIVIYKVLPDTQEHTDSVRKSIEELKPVKIEEEPIAFGLKAFKITMVIPDKSGLMDELDNKIASIPHVNSVETITVSRSL